MHISNSHTLTQLNECLLKDLTHILADLEDDQLLYCEPAIDTRPIRDIAIHAYRPVLAVACVVVQNDWPTRLPTPTNRVELIEQLQSMYTQTTTMLASCDEKQLATTISLPWNKQITALAALIESFTHGFLHTGALQGIRACGGFPTVVE